MRELDPQNRAENCCAIAKGRQSGLEIFVTSKIKTRNCHTFSLKLQWKKTIVRHELKKTVSQFEQMVTCHEEQGATVTLRIP